MVTKKTSLPAAAAVAATAPAPAAPAAAPEAPQAPQVPQATAKTKAAPITPTKLPARQRATLKKPALKTATPVQSAAPKPSSNAAPALAPVKKTAAPEKAKKIKLVRDSLSMPKAEYVVLDELKQRAVLLERPVKKSELLRAGIKLLAALPDASFLAALAQVQSIKDGRPVLEN